MKFINIVHATSNIWFLHQLNHLFFDSDYTFFENSDKEIIWDLVVVYDAIEKPVKLQYKKGGLIFIAGEPPMSNVYTKGFLNQFDLIVTSHPNLQYPNAILSQQALPWHFGLSFKTKKAKFDYSSLLSLDVPEKTNNISVITSSKKMMPGHNRRIRFIESLKQAFPSKIDYYGMGINPIDDKADAILPYRFHICIENSQIPDYWTEKLADSILGYSVPIYLGCTNIDSYFDTKGMYVLSLENEKESLSTIKDILQDPEKAYQLKLNELKENRMRLLTEYNIFPMLDDLIKHKISLSREVKECTLACNNSFQIYKWLIATLRIKRLIFKICHN